MVQSVSHPMTYSLTHQGLLCIVHLISQDIKVIVKLCIERHPCELVPIGWPSVYTRNPARRMVVVLEVVLGNGA